MTDHEHAGSVGASSGGDGTLLPVPRGERRPAERPTAVVPIERAGALVRAVAGAPLVAAAAAGATAAVALSGAAAASRLLSPWSWMRRWSAPDDAERSAAPWQGTGVYISYTHVEIRWRAGR
jgi:hypothetical protein